MSDILPPGNDPVRRSLPRPGPTLDPVERAMGESSEGSVNFNSALLDAVRLSSKQTVDKLTLINNELKGFHKEFTKLAKDFEPQILYYKNKATKWLKVEEQFFREGVKVMLDLKGIKDKFPATSSIYDSTKYGPSTGRQRDADGKFASTSERVSPITQNAIKEERRKEFDLQVQKWRTAFKTANDYAQQPLKLIDAAAVGILASITAGFKRRADAAEEKAQLALRSQALAKEAALEKEIADKQAEDEAAKQDEFFSRLRQVLDNKFPAAEQGKDLVEAEEAGKGALLIEAVAIGTLAIGTLLIDSVILGSLASEDVMSSDETVALIEEKNPEGFAYAVYPDSDEIAEKLLTFNPMVAPPPESAEARMVAQTPARLMLPAPGDMAYGPDMATGPLGASSQPDAADILDDTMDANEALIGPIRDFFIDPANTEVGRFLTKLIGGIEDDEEGGGTKDKPAGTFDLGPATMAFLWSLLPVLYMIGAGVLLIGAGIALIGAGVFVVLWAISRVIGVVAGILKDLAPTIVEVLGSILKDVAKVFAGVAGMLVKFFNDPGGFIGEIITKVMGSIIGAIAKAFNDIPILKSISDALGSIFTSIGEGISGVIRAVSSTIEGVITALGNLIVGPLNLIAGFISALLTLIVTALLPAFAGTLATLAGVGAALMDPLHAGKAYGEAYDQSIGQSAGTMMIIAKTSKADEVKIALGAAASITADKGIDDSRVAASQKKTEAEIARAFDSIKTSTSGAGGNTVNNTSFTTNAPSFASIPILSGGF